MEETISPTLDPDNATPTTENLYVQQTPTPNPNLTPNHQENSTIQQTLDPVNETQPKTQNSNSTSINNPEDIDDWRPNQLLCSRLQSTCIDKIQQLQQELS